MPSGEATSQPASTPGAVPAARTRRSRLYLGGAGIAAAVVLLALAAGFLYYVSLLPNEEVVIERRADGIVALTGGAERIGDAVELLATGRGKRLLITGVNRQTRPEELSRLLPHYERVFTCCVDIDHSAVNTIGNAVETRRWMRERGFRSLVVVTSSYHMPRAMAELAHQLPDVALTAYPVITDRQKTEPWWSNATTAKLLLSEYVKYLCALVRMRFDPPAPETVAGAAAQQARY